MHEMLRSSGNEIFKKTFVNAQVDVSALPDLFLINQDLTKDF